VENTENSSNCQGLQFSLFGNAPQEVLEFNNRRIPQTDTPSYSPSEPNLINRQDLERWQVGYLREYELSQGFDVGVSLSFYKSGEFTAACTALGAKPQKERKKKGQISSTCLPPSAKKIMKRAIQNHWRPFNRMFTFTFDPKLTKNIYNDDGTINHVYAHSEVSRCLATVTKLYKRLQDKTGKRNFELSLIRVSEIQPETGNIHFHVLADRHVDIGYLVRIWGQASNSVNAVKISGMRGLNYLLSYIKKGGSLVYGKRYSLSEHLYGEFKPCKISLVGRHVRTIFLNYMQNNAKTLLNGRGYLGDWGFCVPPPSRDGIPSSEHRKFILGLAETLDENGYPEMLSTLLSLDNYAE